MFVTVKKESDTGYRPQIPKIRAASCICNL